MIMQSYEAIYDHGKMKWLDERPDVNKARVVVTILSAIKHESPRKPGKPLASLVGGLENSAVFSGSSLDIQKAMRDEWD